MKGISTKRSAKAGLPPGSLVHIGEIKDEGVSIRLLQYNEEEVREKDLDDAEGYERTKEGGFVTWIGVSGVHKVEAIEQIGRTFNLHPLLLEDVMNTDQRPKFEDYGEYIFVVTKTISLDGDGNAAKIEQISFVLGADYVITFEEGRGGILDTVRDRIKNAKGRIRKMGADYLLYTFMDLIVDHYFAVMEAMGEKIENLEDDLVRKAEQTTLRTIHYLKREMIFLRRAVWPLREVVAALERGEVCLIGEQTHLYLRDVYDHIIQVMDSLETYRDMLSGMLDIYLSSVSNRLNEVMKVLTVIATIFMPLTFIAGVYGMNFHYMPELKEVWGYPAALLFMAAVAGVMLVYFKRKKWF
jgi:magnesium transporter